MNKLKFLTIIIFFIFNCASQPQLKYEIKGNGDDICEGKKGKEKINCISNILDNYEKIMNATPIIKVLSKERKDEDIVVVTKKYCLDSLCFQVIEETYDPTPWGKIKNYILTGSLSFVAGMATGVIAVK
jgi:hypothetical protein